MKQSSLYCFNSRFDQQTRIGRPNGSIALSKRRDPAPNRLIIHTKHGIVHTQYVIVCPSWLIVCPRRVILYPSWLIVYPRRGILYPRRLIVYPSCGIVYPSCGILYKQYNALGLKPKLFGPRQAPFHLPIIRLNVIYPISVSPKHVIQWEIQKLSVIFLQVGIPMLN